MGEDDGQADLVLAELLERSFGAGPDGLPTPVDRLAEGRLALRRRQRVGVLATAAGVVVVIGVAFSGMVDGDPGSDGPSQLATSGTSAAASETPSVAPSITPTDLQRKLDRLARKAQERTHRIQQRLVSDQFPASLDTGGELVVKDGWRVTQRVEEPVGFQPPEASLGVVVTDGRRTRWMLLTLENQVDEQGRPTGVQGPTAAADDPGKGYARFEDWLASMVAISGGPAARPLLTVDGADAVHAGPGAQLVEVRPMPVVDGYSAQGDRMAEARREGRLWFVVIRGHGTAAEVIPVDADLLPEPTFAALLDHVRAQSASGEGLR
jgi:hypothetical protein